MKHKEAYMAIFIIIIMMASGAGFVMNYNTQGQNDIRYNDRVFKFEENVYTTEIEGEKVNFYNSPRIIENVTVPEQFVNKIKGSSSFYITKDSDSSLLEDINTITRDMASVLFSTDEIYVQKALTTNSSEEVPTATCDSGKTVIYMKESNKGSAEMNGNNCLVLNIRDRFDAIRYRDAIVYRFYDII